MQKIRGTTILAVRRKGLSVIAGDGQVSLDTQVLKHNARKVRTLVDGKVLAGFAGSTADAMTLFEKFEGKLKEYSGALVRAAVELAKDWRTDRILRRLEALLMVADESQILLLSGNGDVIEPDINGLPEGDAVMAIGSGGAYALAAARALLIHSELDAEQVARASMAIAADICVFTNEVVSMERLEKKA
ncbi:MAG: ATP-dependent protease subunit HslV [Deltaproteobacteria bacterium]|nr:ATP-dependent protease subunit HslV [Deltaproteobacteria bacterium]